MLYSGIDPESCITEYILVYEEYHRGSVNAAYALGLKCMYCIFNTCIAYIVHGYAFTVYPIHATACMGHTYIVSSHTCVPSVRLNAGQRSSGEIAPSSCEYRTLEEDPHSGQHHWHQESTYPDAAGLITTEFR